MSDNERAYDERAIDRRWASDDWADLRWARQHSTPQQTARHLLDPQWPARDYNALDELVEMTHTADLSALDADDIADLAASELPELRQAAIRYEGTPATILEDMARGESNTRLLQMLVDTGRLGQRAVDLCCWRQTDHRLAARMLPAASDRLVARLAERDDWTARKTAIESGRLDSGLLNRMTDSETHPEAAAALIATGRVSHDRAAGMILRIATDPNLPDRYMDPTGRVQSKDRDELSARAARTMLDAADPAVIGRILCMDDEDTHAWRTLIDMTADRYADRLNRRMLDFIAICEGNAYAKARLATRPAAETPTGPEPTAGRPADENEAGLERALAGHYGAFEGRIIGWIDEHDPDAGTAENGAEQLAGYEITRRRADGTPESYRLDWFDDTGTIHEGPEITQDSLRRLRDAIFDSPDSWDSFSAASHVEEEPGTGTPKRDAKEQGDGESEQLALDLDDMPDEFDPQVKRGNNIRKQLDTVSNSGSPRETGENETRKGTSRNDGHILPIHQQDQEDEVPVHGGTHAGTAPRAQEAGDARDGRVHERSAGGIRPDDDPVHTGLDQDPRASEEARRLGTVVQGPEDGGAHGRGGRHPGGGRSPLSQSGHAPLNPDLQRAASSLDRARANVRAIEVLRELDGEGLEPTDADLAALAAYAGWGGAQDAFREDSDAGPAWSALNARLRELLSDEEYADARSSTLTAFYTPRPVADAIWNVLSKAGFGHDPKHPDTVLEPGCGTGNFIRSTPPRSSYMFTGIEADPISAGIARHLCPDDDIINDRMERTGLPSDAFDLAVGNVPYSDAIRIKGVAIHDWFIQHSLDAVRPGGLVAVLTSRFTLDKNMSGLRRELARQAELVAACRLPKETFGRQAGTEVVSDILILRKRDRPLPDDDASAEWVGTAEFRDGITANRLFVDHPEYVAGTMGLASGPFGPQIDVTGDGDIGRLGHTIEGILSVQLESYGHGLHDRLGDRANEPLVAPGTAEAPPMRHTVDGNGHIWYGNGSARPTPVHSRVKKGGDARLADMLRLRDQAEWLLALERDPESDDETVARGIDALDAAYERFVGYWGRINSKENLRAFDPNNTDPSLARLYTLERTGSEGFESKGDMLSKRVVNPVPPMPEHLAEPVDALSVSLDREGVVDLDLIGRLLGTGDADETLARLDDLVIIDPDTDRPLPAAEYLSGDVGGKLDHVDRMLRDLTDGPERERVHDWLAQYGLDDASVEPVAAAERARADLGRSGAWRSATDPIHATTAVVAEPWFADAVKQQGGGIKMAVASMFVDDCKPGVSLLAKDWDAAAPQGNALFAAVFVRGWGGEGVGNSVMRMLHKAVTADPRAIDERTLATILNIREFRIGMASAALRSVTADLWGTTKHGIYEEHRCDTLALARHLRAHPEITEYLYAMDAERLRTPAETTRHGHRNSWTERIYRDLSEMVSPEGLEQWRIHRAAWMDANPAREVDMDQVQRLRALFERLASTLPERLTKDDITAKLGAAWIPAGVIRDFMIDTFRIHGRPDITEGNLRSLSVSHDETTGNWQVNASLGSKLDEETIQEYGLGTGSGRNPFEIVSGALNSTTSNLTKPDPADTTGKRRVKDTQSTALLYQKRHAVEQAFGEWVWRDPERTRMLEDVYNRRFNRIRPRDYDGSHLTFPGIASGIDLYAHQRRAVARILQSDEGTLIAHVVGAGKTFTGIAACHEAKRLGRASKPMIVVPNHLTEQWAKDYLTLYPDANVLSMTEVDGAGKGAERFWAKVSTGDWDAVIVRQDTFQRMHVSPERRRRYFETRKREMLKSIETSKTDGNDFAAKKLKDEIGKMERNLNKTVKQSEKDRMRIDGRLQSLRGADGGKGWLDFEDLGVDMLFVDEAHQYKNLAIATTISVPGVDVAAAAKCEDLFDKCELLREQGKGANIVFATGTPVSNSMAELYNMQRYLAPNLLKAQGVEAFTSWANTYGSIIESVEVKPEGSGYQIKQRFSKFHNLPELMSSFHTYADLLTADKLDLDVPDCDTIPVAVEATERQKEAVAALVERAELVRAGNVDPSQDNMLNITNDGRKVSLDPKLLDVDDPDIAPMEGGKVQACAERIHEIWKERAAEKATQLVFCDSSTTASGRWNIQSDLKRRLIERGIPETQIAFAAEEKDPRRKQALFDKVRRGEVRVLIGSTGTLGTGTNVQDRLIAVHDLDCPWKPAELEQRQGRVRRQGNMFGHVYDYRYVTVGTFDSYMFQTVERKAGFVGQIMNSDSPAREAADVDESVLGLAEMKALATGDPNIAKRMEIENRLTQMKLLKRAHAAQQKAIRFKIDTQLRPTVDNLERLHREAVDDEPAFRHASEIRERLRQQGVCGLDLGDGPITDRKQAIHDLVGIARRLEHGHTVDAGEYCGMRVVVESRDMSVKGLNAFRSVVGLKGEHTHWASSMVPDATNSAHSVMEQLNTIISGNTGTAASLRTKLENAQADLDSAWNALNRPWSGQDEYDRLTAQISLMDTTLKNGPQREPDETDGAQPDLAESALRTDGTESGLPMPDPACATAHAETPAPALGM